MYLLFFHYNMSPYKLCQSKRKPSFSQSPRPFENVFDLLNQLYQLVLSRVTNVPGRSPYLSISLGQILNIKEYNPLLKTLYLKRWLYVQYICLFPLRVDLVRDACVFFDVFVNQSISCLFTPLSTFENKKLLIFIPVQ